MIWSGTGTALITPFSGYDILFDDYKKIIERNISDSIDFLVPLGSTGEAMTLDAEEQRSILDLVLETVQGRVPIVAGNFGGSDTRALTEKIKHYNFDGISAILVSSPAYNKPTQEGIYQHYCRILDVAPVDVILYNVPGRTSSNVLPETIARIAEQYPQLTAVKEACGDLRQIEQLIQAVPDHVSILSGDDPTALDTVRLGGKGVISVISNALPHAMQTMIAHALAGRWADAQNADQLLQSLHPLIYEEGNPAGVKALCHILHQTALDTRLPLVAASQNLQDRLRASVSE